MPLKYIQGGFLPPFYTQMTRQSLIQGCWGDNLPPDDPLGELRGELRGTEERAPAVATFKGGGGGILITPTGSFWAMSNELWDAEDNFR